MSDDVLRRLLNDADAETRLRALARLEPLLDETDWEKMRLSARSWAVEHGYPAEAGDGIAQRTRARVLAIRQQEGLDG